MKNYRKNLPVAISTSEIHLYVKINNFVCLPHPRTRHLTTDDALYFTALHICVVGCWRSISHSKMKVSQSANDIDLFSTWFVHDLFPAFDTHQKYIHLLRYFRSLHEERAPPSLGDGNDRSQEVTGFEECLANSDIYLTRIFKCGRACAPAHPCAPCAPNLILLKMLSVFDWRWTRC